MAKRYDISQMRKELLRVIQNSVTDAMLLMFAEHVRDTIYRRTKSGKGLTKNKESFGNNSLANLKKLSPAYIKYRQRKILGPFGKPDRSNLTFSGELLGSIIARMSGKRAIVEVQGGKHWSGLDVKEIARLVSDNGRPFFGLSDTELKTFENFMRRKIREHVRKTFK